MSEHVFSVTNSELLFDGPILALRRDLVTMPGGGNSHREIVEHFGAVAVVAVAEEGPDGSQEPHVAMVHQYRHSVGERLWELPAGLLDLFEEDALICAQRELQEEAGLEADSWSLLTDLVTSPGFCEETVRVYLARGLRNVDKPEARDEEADMTFAWVPLAQARRAVLAGEIVNSIAIAGLFAASEVLAGREQPRPADAPFDLRPTSMATRRGSAPGIDMKIVARG